MLGPFLREAVKSPNTQASFLGDLGGVRGKGGGSNDRLSRPLYWGQGFGLSRVDASGYPRSYSATGVLEVCQGA